MSVYTKKLKYILVIVTLFLIGCSNSVKTIPPEDIPENNYNLEATPSPMPAPVILTLDDVLAITNNRRHAVKPPDEEQLLKLVQDRNPGDVTIKNLISNGEKVNEISTKEAIEDANIFFDLLRNYYGPYNHFGGDEVFLPIFDDIITSLEAQEQWYAQAFYYLLYNQLSTVITDNHFYMGITPYGTTNPFYQAFSPSYSFLMSEMLFDKIDDRFRQRETGLFVKEVRGHNIDEVFRLSMDENGEIHYLPFVIRPSDEGTVYNIEIVYDNETEETLTLTKKFCEQHKDEGTSLRYEGDIPIVTNRNMVLISPDADVDLEYYNSLNEEERLLFTKELKEQFPSEDSVAFLSSAEELQDAPVIVVDMRSNIGGDSILPKKWLNTVTGENIPNSFVWMYPNEKEDLARKYTSDWETYFPMSPIGNYQASFISQESIATNEQLIILLVDRYTMSSPEAFADQLLNMENTLIIGQNTMGALISTSSSTRYLPNSQIMFMMSDSFMAHMEGEWQEGVGIAPDIWVNGDALKAALAMLGKR